ncbi:hypothetical protein [Myxosarcina sp. GI1]|uniref:hypothetical protein n=1 Tax=Myxosarcina sp. GI1 TaxID=1541065 RepID=UPI000690EAF4|nr:hypothetical protein [Myxosarcina sp. GI1]
MNDLLTDSYADDRPAGKTIGTKSEDGNLRRGVDVEKIIAIDNGALRFQPLVKPGWGRQGIAYGAYPRANGLACAVLLLNGHNTSQAETIEWFYKRLDRWIRGSETESVLRRFVSWFNSRHKQGTVRRILGWIRMAAEVTKFFPLPKIDDNLAVGWFAEEVPNNPLVTGNGFIVRATGAENGELMVRVGNNLLSVFRGLQNVPVYYVVILREQGAAYYAASVPHVFGLPPYPNLRLVAIDPFNYEANLYAGIQQSVLGQIGFRSNTRIYGIKVRQIPELGNWYGTAQAADKLIGRGKLGLSPAEVGGNWQIVDGSFELTQQGAIATGNNNLALLSPSQPSGLIHLLVETSDNRASGFSIVWRFKDINNYWCFSGDRNCYQLQLIENGKITQVSSFDLDCQANRTYSLQILDTGDRFSIYLDGNKLGDRTFEDTRLQTANKLGIKTDLESQVYFRYLEAHPRSIPLPEAIDLGFPWWREGNEIIIKDDFSGKGDLAGTITTAGNKIWRKEIGRGAIALDGDNTARVVAEIEHPNPERTAYTVAWDVPDFADVAVEIIPPGTERGKGDKGRGGLIFWQDKDNYIIINTWLDDFYEGESISCFFRIDGFEEVYDAVWSNIGTTIGFGRAYTLRVVFDGNNYSVRVNNQTVLYRALTDIYSDLNPLAIQRVGIVANWEWGNDTGSKFRNFIAQI